MSATALAKSEMSARQLALAAHTDDDAWRKLTHYYYVRTIVVGAGAVGRAVPGGLGHLPAAGTTAELAGGGGVVVHHRRQCACAGMRDDDNKRGEEGKKCSCSGGGHYLSSIASHNVVPAAEANKKPCSMCVCWLAACVLMVERAEIACVLIGGQAS